MHLRNFYLFFLAIFFNISNAQSTASKQVTTFVIEAPQLDTLKTIWVYLPKNYSESKKNYPVIYMHDAKNLFDQSTAYAGEWKIDEYLDNHKGKESIIIGIEHGNEKRIDELTPYTHTKYGGGKGEAYIAFIKNTLKPHIDRTYRTRIDKESTSIFGSSLGGLISLYAVIKYPDTFSKAGIFSPALWINPEIYDLIELANIPKSSRFYFLAGTAEGETMIPNKDRMVNLLKSKGVNTKHIENHSIEGGEHNEAFWASHFSTAYQWLNN